MTAGYANGRETIALHYLSLVSLPLLHLHDLIVTCIAIHFFDRQGGMGNLFFFDNDLACSTVHGTW